MSLAPNTESGYHSRAASGKTPPPAPSAAFARRARELAAEERLSNAAPPARYRPPALRAGLSSNGSTDSSGPPPPQSSHLGEPPSLAPTNFPPGFRRARAGTLPSNVQLAAQNYASSLNPPAATSAVHDFGGNGQGEIPHPTSATTPATTNNIPARPSLRHAASVATSAAVQERNSRLRSGSLTIPAAGLSNAFGPSIFSSSWLTSSAGFPVLDEMRSITSGDSNADEYDVHTLDYLGLDDGPSSRLPPPAATISELRHQAQAAIAGSIGHTARMRASTVSGPYRHNMLPNNHLSVPDDEVDEVDEYNLGGGYVRPRMDSYDSSMAGSNNNNFYNPPSSYIAKGFRQAQHLAGGARPRATSVGNLDDPNRSSHRRGLENVPTLTRQPSHGSLTDLTNDSVQNGSIVPTSVLLSGASGMSAAQTSILRSTHADMANGARGGQAGGRAGTQQGVRFPSSEGAPGRSGGHLAPNARDVHSVSPKQDGPQAQVQTPSRSLWIGNLDSGMTGEDLAHVFAPYGAIESFRLLPEKECGFVNFVDINDAIRAKDDVLNRLGGNIGMANGQTVRIGFGKADSAPATPSSSGNNHASHGGSHASSQSASGPAGANNQAGSIESQLQSTPTRALWIGSIPSTTTPATILSVFSPYGPIESARVLTHKNCGFINFERLDDAVRARKALNGRDVLGSEVGAIRIGFARVPVKGGSGGADGTADEGMGIGVQGVGDLSVGATIHALRGVKGATTVPADQQVLGGSVENYRSNLLLSLIGNGTHQSVYNGDASARPGGLAPAITEQQMIMKQLAGGSPDADPEITVLGDFRPPTMYYTSIPVAAERAHNRRWDASKLRELRKRLDSGACTVEEIDEVAADFVDGEIVDLASDWLGNTVVQKLFEKCSPGPRFAMLERIAPHLAMIGVHKNGTWAAQKIIECANLPDEVALIAQNLRPYTPPLLLDQFGNYVVQCCLRFGHPANDFIFDAMTDRLWEVAQGRFGARSMRACLESPHITINQQRKIATAVVLNSIPLATNPNGALLLTWLLDSSGFHSRYSLLAPRFTPHLSHLCTHKLASLTVLRIVNQKVEPEASKQIVHALFFSQGDHVLTDVLGDQVNGVAVVHKILQSQFLDPTERMSFLETTKRVLIDLKVTSTQAYRRLIEECGLPVPNFPPSASPAGKKGGAHTPNQYGMSPGVYQSPDQAALTSMMQSLQMGVGSGSPSLNSLGIPQGAPPQLQINPNYNPNHQSTATFSPSSDPFNPFALRSPEASPMRNPPFRGANGNPASGSIASSIMAPSPVSTHAGSPLSAYPGQSHTLSQAGGGMLNMPPPPFGSPASNVQQQLYQAYMYQMFQQNAQNSGSYQN